jgi:hypothetical protein
MDPWAYAVEVGATVLFTNLLPPGRRGCYFDDHDRIYLREGLTRPQEHEALAHELAHRHYRDRSCRDDLDRRAEEWAAKLLIHPHAYAQAERYNSNPLAIARELEVTVHMVAIYQQFLDRSYFRRGA